jgi:purine-binding chemotaxis protein CheW
LFGSFFSAFGVLVIILGIIDLITFNFGGESLLSQLDSLKNEFVLFSLDEKRYAISLESVENVVQMVEITAVSGMPKYLEGIINVHGTIMPVVNLRTRMHLKQRSVALEDKLIIVRFQNKDYVLMVDSVHDVIHIEAQNFFVPDEGMENQEFITKIVKMYGNMIFLISIEHLLPHGDSNHIEGILEQVNL